MSSTERAPEPTMEEILASIRRIISDDESSSARQRETSASQQSDEGLEAVEGEADDRIINDIARVLSGASQSAAEEEEDILDLTAELGGLEIVEETTVVVEELELVEATPEPEQAPTSLEAFEPVLVAPVVEDVPQPVAEAAPEPVPEPQFQAPEPAAPPPPMSASEEAASALERAIAALRAGQLPTSISEFMPQAPAAPSMFTPQAPQEPEPAPFYVAPQPEPAPEPEAQPYAFPEPASEFQPEPEPEPEVELVLSDFEAEAMVEEPSPIEASDEAEAPPAWESDVPSWASRPESSSEPEPLSPLSNGHGAEAAESFEGAQKTLEDSVKDMLRPMLQRWLDENMTRVLTAALQDELRDNPGRFQRD